MNSLLTRLSSETPPFWKQLQVACLILSAIVSYFPAVGTGRIVAKWVATGFLAAGAFFAQFAQQDVAIVQSAVADPASLLTNIPAILEQLGQIKATIANPSALTLGSIIAGATVPTTQSAIRETAEPVDTVSNDVPMVKIITSNV